MQKNINHEQTTEVIYNQVAFNYSWNNQYVILRLFGKIFSKNISLRPGLYRFRYI